MKLYHHLRAAIVKLKVKQRRTILWKMFPTVFRHKKTPLFGFLEKLQNKLFHAVRKCIGGKIKQVLSYLYIFMTAWQVFVSLDNLDYIYDVLFAQKDKCGRSSTSKQKR